MRVVGWLAACADQAVQSYRTDAVTALLYDEAAQTPPADGIVGRITLDQVGTYDETSFTARAVFWEGPQPAVPLDAPALGACVIHEPPPAGDEPPPSPPPASAGTLFLDDGRDPAVLLVLDGSDGAAVIGRWSDVWAATSTGGDLAPFDLDPGFALPSALMQVDGWPAFFPSGSLDPAPYATDLHLTWAETDPYATVSVQLQVTRTEPETKRYKTTLIECAEPDDGDFSIMYDPHDPALDPLSLYAAVVRRSRVRYAAVPDGWVKIETSSLAIALFYPAD